MLKRIIMPVMASQPPLLPAQRRAGPQRQAIAETIAANVRGARKRLGLSRKRLAVIAGVSERYLTALENSGANVSIGLLVRIAEALQVDVASLISSGQRDGPAVATDAPLAALAGRMSPAEQQAAAAHLESWFASRRKGRKGLALLGLRGAGKSTLGGRFAARHGLPFLSVTREIEARAGMSLADLFNLGGPDAYRGLENEVVGEFARRDDRIVLETAGGIVGNAEALDLVLGAFTCIWVKASPEEHLARVIGQGDTRPMHGNPKALEHLKALLAAREADYRRSECVLDTSGRTVDDCLAELERLSAPGLFAQRFA